MPYSAVAALMILTTVLLSGCAQQNMAALDDKSGNYFGRNAIANAQSSGAVFVPSFESHYVPPAPVDAVAAQELTPAAPVSTGEPHSMSFTPLTKPPVMAAAGMRWQWPVQGPVTAKFGKQREGVSNQGIIIAAPQGTPIRAAEAGEVAYVGTNVRDYGNMVILRHGNGDMTSYAYAERISVAKGMMVRQGDTVGYVGSTGSAKTPQLHFAMRSGNQPVDPLQKLPSEFASR